MELIPTRSDCTGQHLCGHWRTCERCARYRAAKIADRAQFLEARFGKLALARITPEINSEHEMKKLRDRLVRQKLAPAGIWTIETGEQFLKLHLNLLLPHEAAAANKGVFDYTEPVRSSARSVAAYIAKRKGMPLPHQYSGRLQGEWGSIAQHVMKSGQLFMAPIQAATMQVTLWHKWQHRGVSHFTRTIEQVAAPVVLPVREKSLLEYAEIARRNLSNIYAIVGQGQR